MDQQLVWKSIINSVLFDRTQRNLIFQWHFAGVIHHLLLSRWNLSNWILPWSLYRRSLKLRIVTTLNSNSWWLWRYFDGRTSWIRPIDSTAGSKQICISWSESFVLWVGQTSFAATLVLLLIEIKIVHHSTALSGWHQVLLEIDIVRHLF